jgi:5,10-methylenetetrahydromethanopterin reductase
MTGALPRIGVRLHGGLAPRRCVELAVAAERCGFASVWFAENPFSRGVMPALAACAAATRQIELGAGVVNPYSRHPSLIAMEFAALDELADGRARLGIGSGIPAAVRRMGIANERRLAAIAEAVHLIRALLRGEEVTYSGRVFSLDKVRLDHPPPRPDLPIYMAAMGERSLALCGRIADGLIISNLSPPGFVERAVAIVGQFAASAGRPAPQIVQYMPCVARPDGEVARAAVTAAIGDMLTAFWPASPEWPPAREAVVRDSLIPRRDFAAALDRLRCGEAAERVLDHRFVAAFAIAGDAGECLAQAASCRRAGVGELALTFAGSQPDIDMAYFGGALLRASRPVSGGRSA